MATKVTNGLDLSSQKIVNVADPTANQDAATKKFVDDHNWVSTDITDFVEAVDDRVAALIVGGDGINTVYDDDAGTLTLNAIGTSYSVSTYISNDTWTIKSNTIYVDVYVFGGGSGGSSGGWSTGITSVSGGNGGGGGLAIHARYPATVFSGPVSITIGAGGAGAAGRTTSGSPVAGGAGGHSSFGTILSSASGGVISGTGGQGGSFISSAYVIGTLATKPSKIWSYDNLITCPEYAAAGARGGQPPTGSTTGTSGQAPSSQSGNRCGNGGGGGGGGSGGTTTVRYGGNGGGGGIPSGGGGGGGAVGTASSGSVSGAGGNGGRGEVVVVEWF